MPRKRVAHYGAQFTLLVEMDMWLDMEALQRTMQMGGKSNLIRKILATALVSIMADMTSKDQETFRKVRESLMLTQQLEKKE